MVATRAFLRRNHHNHNGAMDAESSNNQQSEVVDLTISEDEADVVELAQPNAKRQRRNAAAPGGKNPNQTRRGRALKPVNANDNRRTSTRTKATNATTTTTRATRSSSNAGLKPVAVAATARVVSENPSTKRAKVTRTTTTTTTTNNPRKRKAPSRPTAAYAFRKKAHVPIKTPATTEPTTSSGNDATSTHKPQRRGRGNNNSALSSKAAVTSKKRRSRSSTAKGGRSSTKQYQYDANADDIDARDQDDPLSVTAYVEDIYDYYREREPVTTVLKPLTTDCQPHVTEKMRMILVDWILEVHYKFKMNQESLYLAINILDRFLYMSTEEVSRRQLQLVGVTSLLLAAKYEEMFVPELRDLAYICDGAYTESQVRGIILFAQDDTRFKPTKLTKPPFFSLPDFGYGRTHSERYRVQLDRSYRLLLFGPLPQGRPLQPGNDTHCQHDFGQHAVILCRTYLQVSAESACRWGRHGSSTHFGTVRLESNLVAVFAILRRRRHSSRQSHIASQGWHQNGSDSVAEEIFQDQIWKGFGSGAGIHGQGTVR